MKKIIVLILIAAFLMISFSCMAIAANAPVDPAGPAPNSGDGVSDGSGLDNEPLGTEDAKGPAPNSGLCLSDGSGF